MCPPHASAVWIVLVGTVILPPAEPRIHRVEYTDLPPPIRARLADRGIDEARFAEYLRHIDADTARRLEEGDRDELIHYALQSQRFTRLPRIERALSAR